MRTKSISIFVLFILTLTSILFQGCDKDGNPLTDGRFVEITYKGETFIQEGKILALNGSIKTPNFEYNYYNLPQYANGVKFITLNAGLHKKDTKEKSQHSIMIKIPVGDQILLNHEYSIKSLPGKQIILKGDEDYGIYDSENISYIRYNSYLSYSQFLYGSGKVYFTKLIKKENGAEDIEGTFEFAIPSFAETHGFDLIKGKFKLYINKI